MQGGSEPIAPQVGKPGGSTWPKRLWIRPQNGKDPQTQAPAGLNFAADDG